VWKVSYQCFTCGKNICYKILTFLFGIFVALEWGCVFAMISFSVIWCWGPFLRALHIMLHPIKKILQILLSAFVGPAIEVYALIFSRIHVTQSQGPPPKPMDMINGDGDGNMHYK
jgi:caveolin 3